MDYTFPDYYREFRCIADKCPDTCCAGWQIVIDRNALEKYRKYPGGFGNRLHNSIDWKEAAFKQYDKRCAFLNEQKLCDIYKEAGADMLCRTCRRYPRHYEEFENVREISLSLSCPEVARMLLNRKTKVRFHTVSRGSSNEEYEEFDFLLFTKLEDTRELLTDILQERKVSGAVRMAVALVLVYKIQEAIRENTIFEIDVWLERFREVYLNKLSEKLTVEKWLAGYGQADTYRIKKEMFACLYELEVLQSGWTAFLQKCQNALYGSGETDYLELCRQWQQAYHEQEIQTEQLMVYFVFTYFCGSVYDEHPLSKMKTAIYHTLMIQELEKAVFAMDGQLTRSQAVKVVYSYAREIEHSDLNLNQVERMVRGRELFSMKNLLGILNQTNHKDY